MGISLVAGFGYSQTFPLAGTTRAFCEVVTLLEHNKTLTQLTVELGESRARLKNHKYPRGW